MQFKKIPTLQKNSVERKSQCPFHHRLLSHLTPSETTTQIHSPLSFQKHDMYTHLSDLYGPLNSYRNRITQCTVMVFKSSCMSKSPKEVLSNMPQLRSQPRSMNSEAPEKEPRCGHVIF